MLTPLDMFSIGIGPSSSHTIGPCKAALTFIENITKNNILNNVESLKVKLYGSLALTGKGHGTDIAILNGLSGNDPRTVEPNVFKNLSAKIVETNQINLANKKIIKFNMNTDIIHCNDIFLKEHPNALEFFVYDNNNKLLKNKIYFSIGGGFIVDKEEFAKNNYFSNDSVTMFKTAEDLKEICIKENLSLVELMFKIELSKRPINDMKEYALMLIKIMHESVQNGLNTEGIIPGGLNIIRRAPNLYNKLKIKNDERILSVAYAIAVNEENASFGRVVTAPTNGSAGTIAGVLEYYRNQYKPTEEKLIEFIMVAGAIGMLYKLGASISAAEVGCQGEIGVACSMASAALTAVLGGSLMQITKAAEMAMEHHLGMTCDPILGLVQAPCIERNGVAASKAIDIATIALSEEKDGIVSLDDVIKTMLQTGKDMSHKYKETALGGLAVNIATC